MTRPQHKAPSSSQVAVQLARLEVRRVVLHPATIIGLALAVWAMWGLNWGEAPVLNRAGANTSLPLVLIGAGGLIAVSEAAVRMWRTEQSEAIDVAPASPRIRTTALLIASSAPVLLALLLQVVVFGLMMLNHPVTTVDWWDALAGPTTVAVLSASGVAAGRWAPSRLTAPLLLVLLFGASLFVGSYRIRQEYGDWTSWLAPVVPLEFDPVELAFRPTGQHLIYLTGLVAVFIVIALLRGPVRRSLIPVAMLMIALGLVTAGVAMQSRAFQEYDFEQRLNAYLLPDAEYVCENRASVTYCAYPGYEPWITEWAALVEPVIQLAPDTVRDQHLTVRQYPTRALDLLLNDSNLDVNYEPGLATGMWWGRKAGGGANSEWGGAYPFGMALGTASWIVGLPLEPTAGSWAQTLKDGEVESSEFVPGTAGVPPEEISYQSCTTSDQGRAVVALWMAAQASPVTEQHLRNQIENPEYPLIEEFREPDGSVVYGYQGLHGVIDVGQPYPWYALEFHIREAYYAYQLIDRPDDQVLEVIHANWDKLTDPMMTTLGAVSILGMEPIPGFEDTVTSQIDPFSANPPCE